jgi:hypothetical protein
MMTWAKYTWTWEYGFGLIGTSPFLWKSKRDVRPESVSTEGPRNAKLEKENMGLALWEREGNRQTHTERERERERDGEIGDSALGAVPSRPNPREPEASKLRFFVFCSSRRPSIFFLFISVSVSVSFPRCPSIDWKLRPGTRSLSRFIPFSLLFRKVRFGSFFFYRGFFFFFNFLYCYIGSFSFASLWGFSVLWLLNGSPKLRKKKWNFLKLWSFWWGIEWGFFLCTERLMKPRRLVL